MGVFDNFSGGLLFIRPLFDQDVFEVFWINYSIFCGSNRRFNTSDCNVSILKKLYFAANPEFCSLDPKNDIQKLGKKLFCEGYDRAQRPVKDHTKLLSVGVHMILKSYDFVSFFF